jgi:hypothetical protein
VLVGEVSIEKAKGSLVLEIQYFPSDKESSFNSRKSSYEEAPE